LSSILSIFQRLIGGNLTSVLALAAVSLVLASCNLFGSAPPPCPQVAIMDQAKKVTFYRPGPGRDLTDVTFEVAIRDLAYECSYDFDDDGNSVTVNYNVLFVARRGPAAAADQVEVPYFSAVTNAARQILAKEQFTATLQFSGNEVRTQSVQELTQTIPFSPGVNIWDYHSFIGLQLTLAQLEESKRERSR
jgi:hypothetical protein